MLTLSCAELHTMTLYHETGTIAAAPSCDHKIGVLTLALLTVTNLVLKTICYILYAY